MADDVAVPVVGVLAASVGAGIEVHAGRMGVPVAAALAVGAGLLLAESATGTGFAGVLGASVLAVALMLGWEAGPARSTLAFSLPAGVVALFFWSRQHTGLTLPGSLSVGSGGRSSAALVGAGAEGVALSALRPYGTARFSDVDLEVRVSSGAVEPGARLRVVAVGSDGVVVETF